ncbi:cellulase family glycosylhydrolase [Paenibacillus massiliensis]|uniref:cellulase family glycosylhydrolase n=1 Tax=Paenibacillus massiliensis TaxID=225917 RepID=UPI0004140BA2|nr:cellulase family glycosylhydrolase [Paenibacillus massiliensis]
MKRFTRSAHKGLLLVLSAMLCLTLFTPEQAQAAEASVKGFYVSGTKLMDATGKPFIMRGVNHSHTWFKNDLEAAIPAIAATGSNTVRIVLSNGSRWTEDSIADVERILALCDQYKLTVMLEVHDATGSDSVAELRKAADYWVRIKEALIGREDRVIVNIANEWYGSWDSSLWATGYQEVIPYLRAAGIKNTLVVDSAGWGQYPNSIFTKGEEVFASDPLSNLIFSIHMYEYAGGNAQMVKNNIDNALAIGVPVIIGEFGHKHTDGDVDEATIMSYGQEKSVGWLAWSWYGNSGGVDYLDLNRGPAGALTDWGQAVVNGPNGTLATSKLNSIYTTPGYEPVPADGGEVTVPAAPTRVVATAGDGQISLSWGSSFGAASYTVQRALTSEGPYEDLAAEVTGTSYVDEGLSNGTTYYYKVLAVNSAGASPASVVVQATPQETYVPVGNLEVHYRVGDTSATDNQIKPYLNIHNTGSSPVELKDLKLRYYLTRDGDADLLTFIDWAQLGAQHMTVTVGSLDSTNADTYIELGFKEGAGVIPAGGSTGDIQLRVHKSNWTNFDESGDYSYDPTKTSYTSWEKITLHQTGELVFGLLPRTQP